MSEQAGVGFVRFLIDEEKTRQARLASEERPMSVVIPGFGEDGKPRRVVMTYAEGMMLKYELDAVLRSLPSCATNTTVTNSGDGQ